MSYTLLVPAVHTATITPNPVNHNAAYLIAVAVTEIELLIEPIIRYCGMITCGEEGID